VFLKSWGCNSAGRAPEWHSAGRRFDPVPAKVKRDIRHGRAKLRPDEASPGFLFYRSDAVGIRQYGLIAEEGAEVMPELVQFTAAGEAETVRYHFLAALLPRPGAEAASNNRGAGSTRR
jgi:hypothetical protein